MKKEVTNEQILDFLKVMHADVSTLKVEVSEIKKDISSLKTDVSILKNDVSILQKDVSGIKEELKEFKFEMREFKHDTAQRFSDLHSKINDTNGRLDRLEQDQFDMKKMLTEIWRSREKVIAQVTWDFIWKAAGVNAVVLLFMATAFKSF